MKIAIFTDAFIPICSGVATVTINLAKGLADKGHKVYIIAPKYDTKEEFAYKNVEVIRVPSISAFLNKDFRLTNPYNSKLKKYLEKKDIDIIHFATPLSLGIQAISIAKALNKPLVGTVHTFSADKQFLEGIHLGFKPMLKIMQKFMWGLNRLYYHKCDLITCPSKTAAKELVANNLSKNIKVISNGVDPSVFDNSKWKEVKKKYNKNGRLLLYVGRIAPDKNVLYLIDCFAKVASKIKDVKLIIVGDGSLMGEMKKRIEELKLKDKIILTGRIEYDKLVKSSLYKACDLFVMPSIENQPMAVLEAQVNNMVCVGINFRGMKDLIKDSYNGYLTQEGNQKEFSDKIIKLLSDNKLLNRMKKNVPKEVKVHELPKVIEIWEENYQKLIKNKR